LKHDLTKKAYSKDTDSVVAPKTKEKKDVTEEVGGRDQELIDFYQENGIDDDFGAGEDDLMDPNEQNSDQEYYNAIKAQTEAAKREKKQVRQEAHDQLLEPMELDEELGEGDKRKATYKILANRGLTPYRKKENRNPRVKKKIKYENALKKIGSVKRLVVDKSKVGKYHGEVTGIKANLARSVRF
jgi:U3 small nucleolar RNA-associated protein 3